MMAEANSMPDPTHSGEQLRIIYHIALGELEKAVELVEGECARGEDWLDVIAYDPLYTAIRNDPRVRSILRKIEIAF